jgi:ribosomal protein S18 acetylase RimI-like enzyme
MSDPMPDLELRHLGPGDDAAIADAAALFDKAPVPSETAAFLAAEGHHLILALQDGEAVGFVSAVEMIHPDKGRELFLYELGVAEQARGRGVGTALVRALAELARERGCYAMWVLTDADNGAALRAYRKAGATATSPTLMLEWRFDR